MQHGPVPCYMQGLRRMPCVQGSVQGARGTCAGLGAELLYMCCHMTGGGQVPEPRKLAGLLVDRLDLEAKVWPG